MSKNRASDQAEASVEQEAPPLTPQTPPAASHASEHSLARNLDRYRTPRWRRRLSRQPPPAQVAERLAKRLHSAAEALLDRLFAYLSQLPEESDDTKAHRPSPGLTLPASAIGWLAMQIYPSHANEESFLDEEDHQRRSVLSATLRDRISLLKFLLPRLTHLRVTGDAWPRLTTTKTSGSTTAEVEDVDSSFLEYFDALVHRPRVDLRLFPHLQVLLLDQVAPEWIMHLTAVRHSLQVLRMERSCIFDLRRLLSMPSIIPIGDDLAVAGRLAVEDPLRPSHGDNDEGDPLLFGKLTHLKLTHCQLSEASGLRRKRGQAQPLAKLFGLQSICLSHNELSSQRAVLDALSNKPFLQKVDLSFNRLTTLKQAHLCLGNIQTLQLSHNRLQSVEGIDRLYALQTLCLDHNEIEDLASVSGLARLPELMDLRLQCNPLQLERPRAYRVAVLDLFRERRLATLPPSATFRQLQAALPLLDTKLATIGELKALRERTFRRSESVLPANVVEDQENDGFVLVEPPDSDDRMSSPKSGSSASSSRRRRRGREAQIDAETTTHTFVPVESNSDQGPAVAFTFTDVLESLVMETTEVDKSPSEETDEELRAIADSADEEMTNPVVEPVAPTVEKRSSVDEEEDTAFAILSAADDGMYSAFAAAAEAAAKAEARDAALETPATPSQLTQPLETLASSAELSKEDAAVEEELVCAPNDQSQIVRALDISSLSPIKADDDSSDKMKSSLLTAATAGDTSHADGDDAETMKGSGATTATAAETNAEGPSEPVTPVASNVQYEHVPGSTESQQEGSPETPESSHPIPMIPEHPGTPSSHEYPSPVHLNLRVVSFPGSLWQDDNNSIPSSVGTPHRDEASVQSKFSLAEESSTYDGPDAFKDLNILHNLEVYFELYIFHYSSSPSSDSKRAPSPLDIDNDECQSILETYPKIQLWPIDRKLREGLREVTLLKGQPVPKESFRRVWKEQIVACGRPALRRLTPNRGARYGFHGELLWSAANTSHLKPETVVECRDTIACLSNSAFYVILDHDAVAAKAKDQKRKFPLPIPTDAAFKDAKWPHGLARHPMQTLRAITIGFGFQRLTLRFSNSTFPCPDDFTYILLTANKMQTINLLKEFQQLAEEARSAFNGGVPADDVVQIENDDRHVLDALGVAVAPDIIGAVLHYQIVKQRWKHGDRGEVRRVCVVTDAKLFLLDEDYVGDGSESIEAGSRSLGESLYRLVDSAELQQVDVVQAADADPNAITISIRPLSRLQRTHNWRLVCRDRHGAEQLVEDARKAISLVS